MFTTTRQYNAHNVVEKIDYMEQDKGWSVRQIAVVTPGKILVVFEKELTSGT